MASKLRCMECRSYFVKDEMLKLPVGNFCEMACVTAYSTEKAKKMTAAAQKKAAAEDKANHTRRKRELKDNDKSFQRKKTQALFNKFIRLRDRDLGCISCSKPFNAKYDAGHYRSVGANPELRYEELNNFGQCVHCNQHLSANLINYRIGLVQRIGQEKVDWLEGPHDPKHYTLGDLKTLQRWYQRKIKRLEAR